MKVLAVIISVNPPRDLIHSLEIQTAKPDIILANSHVPLEYSVGERSAYSLNKALETVDLEEYDYLVKLDDDVLLPPDFIEKNIGIADLVGRGRALVIKTEPFRRIMGGRLEMMQAEDTHLRRAFYWRRCTISYEWRVDPIDKGHDSRAHKKPYWIAQGRSQYKLGIPPSRYSLKLCQNAKRIGLKQALYMAFGYAIAFLLKDPKAWFAPLQFAQDNRLKFVSYGKKRRD